MNINPKLSGDSVAGIDHQALSIRWNMTNIERLFRSFNELQKPFVRVQRIRGGSTVWTGHFTRVMFILRRLFLFYFSPVNLVDSYENRVGFACAFGATTSKCLDILFNGDFTQIFTREEIQYFEKMPSYTSSKQLWKIALLKP